MDTASTSSVLWSVKRVVTLPSLPQVVSRPPLEVYRVRANLERENPPATILTSPWAANALAESSLPGAMSVRTFPSPPKVVSSLPPGVYRARAKSEDEDGVGKDSPAARIL